jgi:hypothetical protein
MKNIKTIGLTIASIIYIILALVLVTTFWVIIHCVAMFMFPNNSMEEYFSHWEIANEPSVGIVVNDDVSGFYLTNGQYFEDYEEILSLEYGDVNLWDVTFLLETDGTLYGTYMQTLSDEEYRYTIDIFQLHLETREVSVLFSQNYFPLDNSQAHEKISQPKIFCLNCEITIYDGTRVTVFHLDSGTVEEFPPESFSQPENNIAISPSSNPLGYKITRDGEERFITVEYMAQRNAYVKDLSNLEEHKTLFGKVNPMGSFFEDCVEINGKLYLTCVVLDRDGERNYLIFSYNFEKDQFECIFHTFFTDRLDISFVSIEVNPQ